MYTQCPYCQANFEVNADQLKVGDGDVRCGRCLSIFHALSYLTENLPARAGSDDDPFTNGTQPSPASIHHEPELGDIDNIGDATSPWPDADQEERPGTGDSGNISSNEYSHDDDHSTDVEPIDIGNSGTNTGAGPSDTLPEETVTPAATVHDGLVARISDETSDAGPQENPTTNLPAPLLRQLREEKAASLRPPATRWIIGSLLLLVLLLAQGSYFYRDDLALREPRLRPWLEQACGYLDCTIQRPASQAKIDILGWDVRTLPDTPQALLASTTLVNKTPAMLPYPLLTLRFSDINGAPLAQRRFLPREYLPTDTDIKAGMTPDTPVMVELALVDPGKKAVNFEFHTESIGLAQ